MTAAPVRCLSSLSGNGVNAWLDEVLGGTTQAGTKILEIDYEHYARAEAHLAWLNCRVSLTLTQAALAPAAVVGPMLENLDHALTQAGFQIAHLKVSDDTASGFLKASVTANGQEPSLQGDLCASPATVHELLLNIRAGGEAVQLRRVVEAQLGALPGSFQVHSMQCFHPSPPKNEYRLAIASGFSSDKSLR
jgi:hypothetical protein